MSAPLNPKVARTRNAGTWTEAEYWGSVRSCLRQNFRYWRPAVLALQAARFRYQHGNRVIWAYKCAVCGLPFQRAGVQCDHIEPAGSLRELTDLADFLRRLTPEDPAAYKIVCLRCHGSKTAEERAARVNAKAGQMTLLQP